MKLQTACLLLVLCLLPGALATTITYTTPAVGSGLNASVTAGTGILVMENGTVILISFDTVFGDLRYYPYALNPAGYLTNYTETDPVFSSENSSLWTAINARLIATDQRYNDSLNWIFENGTGINAIQAKGVKGAGQIQLTNGSSNVTGIGTQFIGGGLRNLDAYYAFYIGSTKYFVYPIASNTSATLTATLFGNATNWTGANLTTDFYLLINNASGDESRAFGMGSTASGVASLTLGHNTLASGDYSFAQGDETIANATYAMAMGSSTVASGLNSFAAGLFTIASGNTAFATGQNTLADGLYGVAMGYGNRAGSYSFAFGRETNAEAVAAVSMGYKTNVTSYAELAIGRYNLGGGTFNSWVNSDYAFEVGNGVNSSNRSNAFSILKNGNVSVAGNLTVTGNLYENYSRVCTAANGLCGGGVFGTQSSSGASDGESTTSSTSFQTKLTLVSGTVPTGTYRLGWTYGSSGTSLSYDTIIQVNEGATVFGGSNIEPKDTNTWYEESGFAYITYETAASHTFTIQYASENVLHTAKIRRVRLEFWRVS